jgi:hypothetical protein
LPLLVTAPEAPEAPPCETGGVTAYTEALARATAELPAVADPASSRPDELRPAVAALLVRLARRAEPALLTAMQRAREAWDQADAFSPIDPELEVEIGVLRRHLAAATGPRTTAARRAIALEGLLAIDAALAVVRLFERRLAALQRLRLRSATPELLPGGRPFLDLGRALHEAAEAWR